MSKPTSASSSPLSSPVLAVRGKLLYQKTISAAVGSLHYRKSTDDQLLKFARQHLKSANELPLLMGHIQFRYIFNANNPKMTMMIEQLSEEDAASLIRSNKQCKLNVESLQSHFLQSTVFQWDIPSTDATSGSIERYDVHVRWVPALTHEASEEDIECSLISHPTERKDQTRSLTSVQVEVPTSTPVITARPAIAYQSYDKAATAAPLLHLSNSSSGSKVNGVAKAVKTDCYAE